MQDVERKLVFGIPNIINATFGITIEESILALWRDYILEMLDFSEFLNKYWREYDGWEWIE